MLEKMAIFANVRMFWTMTEVGELKEVRVDISTLTTIHTCS